MSVCRSVFLTSEIRYWKWPSVRQVRGGETPEELKGKDARLLTALTA